MSKYRSSSASRGPPMRYYVHRKPNRKDTGFDSISRTQVEDFLREAPVPPYGGSKKFPKLHRNREGDYAYDGNLYEFPTSYYPYDKQNYKGKLMMDDDDPEFVPKGYMRTITDEDKEIQGLSYHPRESEMSHTRATELYGVPSRSDPHYFTSYQTFPSKPAKIRPSLERRKDDLFIEDDFPYSKSWPQDPMPLFPRSRSPPWATHSRPGSPDEFLQFHDLSHGSFGRRRRRY